jgi:O-succinylbenzoic acid--CoA ligase
MARTPRLVALDLVPGPDWVLALCRVWDAGDVALPVDPRLPVPSRQHLFQSLDPDEIIRADGVRDPIRSYPTPHPPLRPGDALVVPTSGTTGPAKGVIHTHSGLAAHARSVHRRLGVDPRADQWLACLPLTHVGGLGVVTRALIEGVPLEVHPGFDAERVLQAAERGATLTSLVATALDRIGPDAFRRVVLGGSADPTPRPANVVHTYGLTETGGGVVYEGEALDGVEIAIGGDGQIRVRGPQLLRAYRDGSNPLEDAGWFTTGDLGRIDDKGRLHVDGRRDDLIVTGGENVWPASVEEVLRSHPGVADAAVAGLPDDEWGQRVTAFVVPVTRDRPPTLAGLREHVKRQLPAYAAPRHLVLVGRLPRTALGKIRRDLLRAPTRTTGEPGPRPQP